jgi:hypothetical protein
VRAVNGFVFHLKYIRISFRAGHTLDLKEEDIPPERATEYLVTVRMGHSLRKVEFKIYQVILWYLMSFRYKMVHYKRDKSIINVIIAHILR